MKVLDASKEKITVELSAYEASLLESLCFDSDLFGDDYDNTKNSYKIMAQMHRIFQVYALENIPDINEKLLEMLKQDLIIHDIDIHP